MKLGDLKSGTVSHSILDTISQAGECDPEAVAALPGCVRSRLHELKQMGMVRKVYVLTDAGKQHLAKLEGLQGLGKK